MLAWTSSNEDYIHESLLVNVDQIGIVLIPGGGDKIYETRRSEAQSGVSIFSIEKKRTFIAVLAISMGGWNSSPRHVDVDWTQQALHQRTLDFIKYIPSLPILQTTRYLG